MTDKELREMLQKTIADRINQLCGSDDSPYSSQESLAKAIGTTRQAITNYANGKTKPSITTIYSIAKNCNVSADWLMGISNDPSPLPSAVDDLKISTSSVDNILALHKNFGEYFSYGEIKLDCVIDDFLSSEEFMQCMLITGYGIEQKAIEYIYRQQYGNEDSTPPTQADHVDFSQSSVYFLRAAQIAMNFFSNYYPSMPDDDLEEYLVTESFDELEEALFAARMKIMSDTIKNFSIGESTNATTKTNKQ